MYFEVSTQKVFSAFMLHVVQERCVVLSELLVRGCDTDIEARRWRPWAHSRAPRVNPISVKEDCGRPHASAQLN